MVPDCSSKRPEAEGLLAADRSTLELTDGHTQSGNHLGLKAWGSPPPWLMTPPAIQNYKLAEGRGRREGGGGGQQKYLNAIAVYGVEPHWEKGCRAPAALPSACVGGALRAPKGRGMWGEGGILEGEGGRGVWLGPPLLPGSPMVPAEGGPKLFNSNTLGTEAKCWLSASNIGRGGGGGVQGGQVGGLRPPPPAVYGRSNTSPGGGGVSGTYRRSNRTCSAGDHGPRRMAQTPCPVHE